ncbi:MAG: FAD-binding oxidoreductase [Propionibacteriaceae bacterium]|jgi:glycine/D-amino acid oxidase-like deaminating enzyme|nr:FAD-binding oxidoreductase [Propionibacteriaceae bacterium]
MQITYDAPVSPKLIRESLAGASSRPYWLENAGKERPAFLDGPDIATEWDLVVVGGGFTGLWAALLAKQRDPGLRVALLEAERVAWSASGRNGGFVESSVTHGESNGRNRWPSEYDQLERLGIENLDQIEATVKELGIDCDFQRTGSLNVAVEPYQERRLLSLDPQAIAPARVLSREEVAKEVNSPVYRAAWYDVRTNANVNPAKLAFGLAKAAAEAGVEVFENTKVRGLGRDGRSISLLTDRSTMTASKVVLATNVYPALLQRYRLHTVPWYDYALMTEPLSKAQLAELGWHNRQGLADLSKQFHYYRMTSDNRILFGGYDAVYYFGGQVRASYDNRPETWERLARHFFITYPYLEGIKFTNQWGGPIDCSTSFGAFFGKGYDGQVVHSAGFTGLGVGASRFAARVMLDMLGREPTELTELEMVRRPPLPFPPEPFTAIGINTAKWAIDRSDHNEGRPNPILRVLAALGLGYEVT